MKFRILLLFTCAILLVAFINPKSEKQKAGITQEVFGKMPDGQEAQLFTLRNAAGMEVKITNYGGYIVTWAAPDKNGKQENITLGVPTFADYLKGTPAFGPIIGRYGNRIAKGKLVLDGKEYALPTNGSGNHMHGGKIGFDKKLWTATSTNGTEPSLKLHYTSPDGEEGYPGTLNVDVTYTLQKDNALRIDYRATTDKVTVVNLTNHAYFNLSGMKRDILNQELMIKANKFLPTDATQIPTGELKAVAGTPFDFTKPTVVGARINDTMDTQIKYGHGYDHCWVFTDQSKKLKLGATVYEPVSGRYMEMYTTEPGVQIYTANHLNGKVQGVEGVPYTKRFGLCLETQHFPDSPNHLNFPTTTLRPGETYQSTTVYKLSVK
ncbi:aldose epimerase family protein [Adhaeribacter radiodurans]|uniref:Aldose 1-epimerase n=1 Tax=Adhaeribacter radiodurans TaxID=2745197 RepID=A0A7L7LCY7_9BACT|nr:aldose epimerase family protein [Adhaeribacter radiodurans]QMU30405.1 galactose mutarotase [Adhaeribacter radiodurans]